MFKLERVEILGFKSFYEKVDLAFPGAVTAVVGPNGCGKSNICDAVAWALGEQSAKILRGERMDDVIFNGSAKRRPLGMAEVILTLSPRAGNGGNGNGHGNGNGNGNGHAEAAEGEADETGALRIGRRVYREGHGEYFLNDKQVRLKDIQDRLLGTGLGVRAYSVIEQGRIDQVLSTKPQDRRRLIEEAAGITKYKLKKRLAETKLEETKGNLLRLSDIISEVERNVTSLKRQASRAARYKEKTQELKSKRATLARASHDRLRASASEAHRTFGERQDREAQAAAALARAEADLAAGRLSASEMSGERDRVREIVLSLEAAIQRDDALLEANRRAAADLAERRVALDREGREASAESERTARELAEETERLERAVAQARVRSEAREQADNRAAAAAAALTALERDLDAARSDSLAAAGDLVAARNALHELDVEATHRTASLARLSQTREKVQAEAAQRSEDLQRAEHEIRQRASESEAASERLHRRERELAETTAALTRIESEREKLRDALGAAEHRRDALAEILRGRERTVEAVRESLQKAGEKENGKLSDRIRPRAGWEEAVDLLLGEDLDALLYAGSPDRALAASQGLPRATFVRADWKGEAGAAPEPSGIGGWEKSLENFGDLSAAERAALPSASFVETVDEALRLAERFPGRAFVTRRRELVRGSLVCRVSAPAAAAGIFTIRRDVADLERQIRTSREALSACERSQEERQQVRRALEDGMSALRDAEREAGGALSALAARREERRSEWERVDRERRTIEEEIAVLQQESETLGRRRTELVTQSSLCVERDREARQRAERLSASLPEVRSAATAAAEDLAHRRTEAEVAAERRRALEAVRDRLAENRGALERRVGEASEESRRLSARHEEIAREEREARERQSENLQTRQQAAAQLESASTSAADAAARVQTAEETTRSLRSQLDLAREARFEAEVAQTKIQSDLEHVVNQAREEFGVAPEELPAAPDVTPEALSALEAEAVELAAAIERMGPVNVLAYEEHEEESKRLIFLTTQRDDLVKSVNELQESIRKINLTSSQRFREAFAAINENFKAMFTRLFQGGTAEMHLLDENDLLESGVEIVAQPPGKRNQSILLLSGGEKALTAIALLMAIFRYKPSPFCILDEVDAPLDEVNIDRFTKLLRDMTEETQFIAITHNKRTMETADVMYGVTMEEPGCSKIVSVKFD